MRRILPSLRSLASAVTGYTLLAFANMGFVMVFFVPPIPDWPTLGVLCAAIAYTIPSCLFVGYLVGLIAGRRELIHAAIVAGAMAIVIAISLIIDVAVEPAWYKVTYLATMTPATLWGGRRRSVPPHERRGVEEAA